MSRLVSLLPFAALISFTTIASAQGEAPAPAPTPAAPAEKPVGAPVTATASVTTSSGGTTTATTTTEAAPADTGTDFSKIVRSVGIGYFGAFEVPIGVTRTPGTLTTQIVGVRYFFTEKLGLDVGLGWAMVTGSTKSTTGGTSVSHDSPSTLGFSLKAGVPIVMFSGQHYSFFFEPQAIFGYAGETVKPPAGSTGVPDTKHSGTRFLLGSSAGALIQFGFIGIPQLTMDATVGLGLDFLNGKTEGPAGGGTDVTTNSGSSFRLSTLSGNQPWNIFNTNVEVVYHF